MRSDELTEDVEALMYYAAEADLLTADSPEATEALRRSLLDPLAHALAAYKTGDETSAALLRADLLFYYSALNKLTSKVTGRSYRDSKNANLKSLAIATIVVAIVTLLCEGSQLLPSSKEKIIHSLGQNSLIETVLWSDYTRALLWGALGSCIFLLKSLSDKVTDLEFDTRLKSGVGTRITLGALLAMAVVQIYDRPDSLEVAATAFLAGLGVKVVYRAIESAIEAMAERLDFQSLKRNQTQPPIDIRTSLPNVGTTTLAVSEPAILPLELGGDDHVTDTPDVSLVHIIQSRLLSRGFDPGVVDGVRGPRTNAAITAYLGDITLKEVTGSFSDDTELIGLAELLALGDAPADWRDKVKTLQKDSPLHQLKADVAAGQRGMLDTALTLLHQRGVIPQWPLQGQQPSLPDLQKMVQQGIDDLKDPTFDNLGFSEVLAKLTKGQDSAGSTQPPKP
jgi:peptidoglycan hydrolase-like protein with peptidoglycan-binding domain